MYMGMRFQLYIFSTVFCVHSFFVFLFIMLIWSPTVVSQHLSKSDKRGLLTRWLPRFFANPIYMTQCPSLFTLISYCAIVFSFTLMFANSGVQRSDDARDDCLIGCPLPNSGTEQWRMVVIVTGYTLFVTSQYDVIFRLTTNVLAKFTDTTCIFSDAGAAVGQGEQ